MEEIIYVYESPDGGETIYKREMLASKKELVSQSPKALRKERSLKWNKILEASESDPVLQDLLDRAEVYYELKKEH
jgi:hypothetical protein